MEQLFLNNLAGGSPVTLRFSYAISSAQQIEIILPGHFEYPERDDQVNPIASVEINTINGWVPINKICDNCKKDSSCDTYNIGGKKPITACIIGFSQGSIIGVEMSDAQANMLAQKITNP